MPDNHAPVPPEVLTVDEVAERLRISPNLIRVMARRGSIPGWRGGREWRFWWPAIVAELSRPHPTAEGEDAEDDDPADAADDASPPDPGAEPPGAATPRSRRSARPPGPS